MVNLQDVIKAVDGLLPEERRELREYLERRESIEHPTYALSPDERIQQLDAAAAVIREGMTQEQLDAMTDAMNAEFIEPFDEDESKDWRNP